MNLFHTCSAKLPVNYWEKVLRYGEALVGWYFFSPSFAFVKERLLESKYHLQK